MTQTISSAVGELIKRQQGTVSYTDRGKEVVVTSKPAHYSLHIQLIDKEARKRKQTSVRLDKRYTYPKEIEEAVLWDMLLNMRQAIITYTGEQGIKSWNDTFGKSWPELLIDIPKPRPEPEIEAVERDNLESGLGDDRGNYYNYGVYKSGLSSWWQAYYIDKNGERQVIGTFKEKQAAQKAGHAVAERQRRIDEGNYKVGKTPEKYLMPRGAKPPIKAKHYKQNYGNNPSALVEDLSHKLEDL